MHRMDTLQSSLRNLILFGLLLFTLETLLVTCASLPWLIGQVNADDFYYYLVLARNTAAGCGPSFDGIELTNGFHPMYLSILTLLARLPFETPAFLVRAALILLLFFHNATGVVLGIGFGRMSHSSISWVVALIWLLNPWALAITLHGVEAPIATFLWALTAFAFLAHRRAAEERGKRAVILGILVGLAVLARTDGLFLLGAVMITEVHRAWQNPTRRLKIIFNSFVIGGTTLIVTLPWWWWNWHNFGMITQISSKAVFLGWHGFDWVTNPSFIISRTLFAGRRYLMRVVVYNTIPFLIVGFALWQARDASKKGWWLALKQALIDLDFAVFSVVMLAIWYGVWQWHIQNWYFLPTIMVTTILVGLVWLKLIQGPATIEIKWPIVLITLASVLLLSGVYFAKGFGFPRQERGYYIAEWLNQHTESDAMIGAWNSGIIGYFTQRSVVNLDGVVNNSVYAYMVANQTRSLVGLMGYIRDRQIDYITDYEGIPSGGIDPREIGLEQVYESLEHSFKVYRVDEPAK